MTTVNEGIAKANDDMVFYQITKAEESYDVVNKETDMVEFSTAILPEVLFQAKHLDDMLVSMLATPEVKDEDALGALSVEDVVPN